MAPTVASILAEIDTILAPLPGPVQNRVLETLAARHATSKARKGKESKIATRNHLLHHLITTRKLPTDTLENWRRIAGLLKLASRWLASRCRYVSRKRRREWVSARALRESYRRYRQAAPQRAA